MLSDIGKVETHRGRVNMKRRHRVRGRGRGRSCSTGTNRKGTKVIRCSWWRHLSEKQWLEQKHPCHNWYLQEEQNVWHAHEVQRGEGVLQAEQPTVQANDGTPGRGDERGGSDMWAEAAAKWGKEEGPEENTAEQDQEKPRARTERKATDNSTTNSSKHLSKDYGKSVQAVAVDNGVTFKKMEGEVTWQSKRSPHQPNLPACCAKWEVQSQKRPWQPANTPQKQGSQGSR